MFGLFFTSKVRSVLLMHFAYYPPQIYTFSFNGIVKETKSLGQNEYDAAIKFMIVIMDTLSPDVSSPEAKDFIQKHCNTILKLSYDGMTTLKNADLIIISTALKQRHCINSNCPPTPWGSGGKAVNGW